MAMDMLILMMIFLMILRKNMISMVTDMEIMLQEIILILAHLNMGLRL